jgi:hypothetical protein
MMLSVAMSSSSIFIKRAPDGRTHCHAELILPPGIVRDTRALSQADAAS